MTMLRSAVFNLWFVLATTGYGLAGVWVRVFSPEQALPVAQAWSRAVLAGARLICGIHIEVLGRENLAPGAALIASQHQSAFDTLVWLLLVPRVSYVFKAELERIPLFGGLLRPAGQIPLDRGASFAAVKGLLRGAEKAAAEGRQIVIFPEGTRVAPGAIVELRPGFATMAARTKLPVTPVATDSGRLWGRQAFIKRAGVVHISIGPAIPVGAGHAALMDGLRAGWKSAGERIAACG